MRKTALLLFLCSLTIYPQQVTGPPVARGGSGAANVQANIAGPAATSGAIDISSLNLSADTLNSLVVACYTGTGFAGGKVTGDLTPLACSITARSTAAVTVTFANNANVLVVLNSNGGAGPQGPSGTQVELQKTATHVQWRLVGGVWADLVALADIKGDAGVAGAAGAAGADGKEVELQKTATHIQWRLTGGVWADLVALADIKGDQGIQGIQGIQGPAGANGAGFNGRGTYAEMVGSSPVLDDTWELTDALASGGCGAGAGTAKAVCIWDGAAWVSTSGSGANHAATHVTGGGDTIPNAVPAGDAGLMSGADKTKLDGIAAGAEVNVNADWNAVAGDAQIQNKPTLGTIAPKNATATGGRCAQWSADGTSLDSAGTACGAGSGTPGGSDGQIQYNNNGAFGGLARQGAGAKVQMSTGDAPAQYTVAIYDANGNVVGNGYSCKIDATGLSCGDGSVAGSSRFSELAENGANYIEIKGPDSRDTALTLVLPAADPGAGQVMSCGAPVANVSTCSWVTPSLSTHNHDGTYQPSDSDLTAIAALACAENQIIKRNGAGAWVCGADATAAGGAAFNDITTGSNSTATMTVTTGASIVPSGSGIIRATVVSAGSGVASFMGPTAPRAYTFPDADKTIMATDTAVTLSQLPATARVRSVGAHFLSPTTDSIQYVPVGYACTVYGWDVTVVGGTTPTVTIDVLRVADGTALPTLSIIGTGTKPNLAANARNRTGSVDWVAGGGSVSIAQYDMLGFDVTAVSGSPTSVQVLLYCLI